MTRKERLKGELTQAERTLDAQSKNLEPGKMRTQQIVAGLRARTLALRSEVCQVEYDDLALTSTKVTDKMSELRANRDALLIRVKEAELSARAASKQATEDDLPEVMRRLDEQTEVGSVFAKLH